MVRISTIITAAAVALNYADARPATYFGNAGLEGGIRGELSKRTVVISTIADGTRAITSGPVPIRQNFLDFIKNADVLNLYLLALSNMMNKPQSDVTSHYQVAGIHGRPYIAWDNVSGGNNNGGYCTHADILFLSWHRPYLALYESLLLSEVNKIAQAYPAGSSDSQKYTTAAASFRIPYWDWASSPTIPDLIGNQPTVTVQDPSKGSTSIPNPLYAYKYHFTSTSQQRSELPDAPFVTNKQTSRVDIGTLNSQLGNIGTNLKNRIYNLLTAYDDYAKFSNKGTTSVVNGQTDSLESVHDVIHATVGGNSGEMAYVDYAAHDPLFFLHHTNIDRMFAIWQAIHSGSKTSYIFPTDSYPNNYGTYSIKAGTNENSQTPLSPFHKSEGAYYTSDDVKSTKTFGYVYPETVDWDKPADQFTTWVVGKVNDLYGAGSPAGILTSVTSATKKMSSTTTTTTTKKTTTTTRPPTTTTTTTKITTTTTTKVTTTAAVQPTTTVATTTTTMQTTTAAPTTTTTPVLEFPVTTSTPSGPTTPTNPQNQHRTCANTPWWLWWAGMWDCFFDHGKHHQKRDIISDVAYDAKDTITQVADNVGHIIEGAIDKLPVVKDIIKFAANLIDGDQYVEYIAQVLADNSALNGTYTVYIFIGDYNTQDPSTWPTSPNLVGQHSAFTNIGGGHHFSGSGSVPLTAAIMNLIVNGKIPNLGREAVVPYLKQHLRWDVSTAAGAAIPANNVKDLKVSVVSADVRLPCVDGALPQWGGATVEYGITEGKDGGLCSGQ
ncbi:Tyrosinase [Arthrobotrys entomopaga]|nr:Tyrosinase [Arthrobotrys entomopaga]